MHIEPFRIPCLESCPLSVSLKLSLSSLARYAISGQSDTETKSPLPDTDSLGSTNEPLLVQSVGVVILHMVMQRCG